MELRGEEVRGRVAVSVSRRAEHFASASLYAAARARRFRSAGVVPAPYPVTHAVRIFEREREALAVDEADGKTLAFVSKM